MLLHERMGVASDGSRHAVVVFDEHLCFVAVVDVDVVIVCVFFCF